MLSRMVSQVTLKLKLMEERSEIEIPVDENIDLKLCIYGNAKDTIIEISKELAIEQGESTFQILEGYFYQYFFKTGGRQNHDYQIRENLIIKNSLRKGVSEGRIAPNIYVGSLPLEIYKKSNENKDFKTVYVEVLPTKLGTDFKRKPDNKYRENYEIMLGDIAEKCTELLMQVNSPVEQQFEVDSIKDPKTAYQRFAFVRALIHTQDFNEAVQKILSSPISKWKEVAEPCDIRNIRRISGKEIKRIISGSNRIILPSAIGKLKDVPVKIESTRKVETIDTHENRFVKHALEVFLQFVTECHEVFKNQNFEKSKREVSSLIEILESYLNHPFFKEIERPVILKLNSPALQRKGGYKEILSSWLKFDLAARLIWRGGDDVYKAGKRDIAVLYEYWLFFVLYDLMKAKFRIDNITHQEGKQGGNYNHLIEETKDGLNLMLKSGKFTALSGKFDIEGRKFRVQFTYNKTFRGGTDYSSHREGSWTKPMRPDYTLSIWPDEYDDTQAEKLEKIVHIHFDAKYKVSHFSVPEVIEIMEDSELEMDTEGESMDSLEVEKKEELKGVYKSADLLKMHAYKDAIRRTAGAYVIYPGTEEQNPLKGFHEIIPGLGAFAIRPTKTPDGTFGQSGIEKLSDFIDKVIVHFKNSASQQRRYSTKTYEVHKDKPNQVEDTLPEYLIPDETFIIVGYCKEVENYEGFYKKHGLYNFRMDDDKGSLVLGNEVVNAKYLLLRTGSDKMYADRVFKIINIGPKVYSGEYLKRRGYKSSNFKDFYLVIEIEKTESSDLNNFAFNFTELQGYKTISAKRFQRGMPFTCSLTELMQYRKKE